MINLQQRQQHSPSTISTIITGQQTFSSSDYDEETSTNQSRTKKKVDIQNTIVALKDDDGNNNIIMTPYQLPNELILLIINHVTEYQQRQNTIYECTLVSKQFYAIINPLIWQIIKFRDKNSSIKFLSYISDASLDRLETIGQHIRELTLNGLHWTDTPFLRLIPYISTLKHLCIYPSTRITDTSFEHIPYYCQYHLTSLKLTLVRLSHISFSAIGQYCHCLRDFEWYLRNDQSPEWLELLVRCPLERLCMTSNYMNPNEKLSTIIKTFHHLTCLEITHKHLTDTTSLLLPSTINTNNTHLNHTVVPPWPHLKILALNPCDQLDDSICVGFIKSHPHLQEIHLRNATILTDTSLDAIKELSKLTRLTLAGMTRLSPLAIRQLIHQCYHLEYLKLDHCRFVDIWHSLEVYGFSGRNYRMSLDSRMIDMVRKQQLETLLSTRHSF